MRAVYAPGTVSYTHLDVYKRQEQRRTDFKGTLEQVKKLGNKQGKGKTVFFGTDYVRTLAPVSYTHLFLTAARETASITVSWAGWSR